MYGRKDGANWVGTICPTSLDPFYMVVYLKLGHLGQEVLCRVKIHLCCFTVILTPSYTRDADPDPVVFTYLTRIRLFWTVPDFWRVGSGLNIWILKKNGTRNSIRSNPDQVMLYTVQAYRIFCCAIGSLLVGSGSFFVCLDPQS